MKTDQILSVQFTRGLIHVTHKTLMVESKEFFIVLNQYRIAKGLPALPAANILQSRPIKEYIEHLKCNGLENPVKTVRGRGKSYIHLKVALRCAVDASPEFADEIIDMFISKRLAWLRDVGGEKFLELNDVLQQFAETVLGKPAHKGHYVNLAKTIKTRCGVEDWNSATPEQHFLRAQIEDRLAAMLRTGVVRDWEHLKDLAATV